MRRFFRVFFLALAAAAVLPARAEVSAEHRPQWEACRDKLEVANRAGLLVDIDLKSFVFPTVIVGTMFMRLQGDAKDGFLNTVNCFLTGADGTSLAKIYVYSSATGKQIGEFYLGHFSLE